MFFFFFFDYYMDMVFPLLRCKKKFNFFSAKNILNLKLNTKMLETVMANMFGEFHFVFYFLVFLWEKFYFKFKEAACRECVWQKSFSVPSDNYFNILVTCRRQEDTTTTGTLNAALHIQTMFSSKFINSFSFVQTFTFDFKAIPAFGPNKLFHVYYIGYRKYRNCVPRYIQSTPQYNWLRNEYVNSITL